MLNQVISAVLQVAVFTLIPFLVYIFRYKRIRGFGQYVGLVPSTRKAVLLSLLISVLFLAGALVMVLLHDGIRAVMTTPPSVTGNLREMGFSAGSLVNLLIIAWIKTAFAEELFFRGFVAGRLVERFGYARGNALQALIFGVIHAVLFLALTAAGGLFIVFIFCLSTLAGYCIGYIKEKVGNNSIIPGWIAHGLGNTVSYALIAFVL